MCNDKAWNVVICSLNANIHVVVHEDLHEIYLLNVNDSQKSKSVYPWETVGVGFLSKKGVFCHNLSGGEPSFLSSFMDSLLDILSVECFRNSANTEFRMFLLIPYIPYSIRNCPKFCGFPYYGICRIPRNFTEFHDFCCHKIPHYFYSFIFFHCKNCFMTFILQFFWFYFIKNQKDLCK